MVTPEVRTGYELIKKYNPSKSLLTLPFTTPETIHRRLSHLRYMEYTYGRINALDEFSEVPPGTLQAMYESDGNYIPKVHKKFLRCRAEKPSTWAGVNMADMNSFARTTIKHLGDRPDELFELIDYLHRYLVYGELPQDN